MSDPGQRRDEVHELSRLAFDELRLAVGGIGSMHRGIAGRAFRHVPAGAQIQVVHDALSTGAYAAVRGGFGLAGRAVGAAVANRPDPDPEALSRSPRGSLVLAALQGLRGDALEAEGSPIAQPMAVRVRGEAVDLRDPDALRAAFPDATPRIVVFLHGLMETERSWGIGGAPTYGARLRDDLACTPVFVRYNTGRRISRNGCDLAALLDELHRAWPVSVREIALVGHSMGGLVARSACHHAAEDGRPWVRHVRHTVSLGTPHLGAPLEQAVHYASAALHALPETRPFGGFLRRRSGGIRDLRHGSLVDEDWDGRDPDALRAAAVKEVPLLDGATHCFISATITRSPRHPLGRLIGDLLVLQGSASGRSRRRRIPFREEHGAHVAPATHFALLNHPQVYEQLLRWLADSPAMPEPRQLTAGAPA